MPGIETICPLWEPPRPAIVTSSCSSICRIALSLGACAPTFLPFLISCTLTILMIPECGCFCSAPSFLITISFARGAPSRGSTFAYKPRALRFHGFFSQRLACRSRFNFLPANNPLAIHFTLNFPAFALCHDPHIRIIEIPLPEHFCALYLLAVPANCNAPVGVVHQHLKCGLAILLLFHQFLDGRGVEERAEELLLA